jgi:hypothetical protein
MKIKIFCRCSLFPSGSGEGLLRTPVPSRNDCLEILVASTSWDSQWPSQACNGEALGLLCMTSRVAQYDSPQCAYICWFAYQSGMPARHRLYQNGLKYKSLSVSKTYQLINALNDLKHGAVARRTAFNLATEYSWHSLPGVYLHRVPQSVARCSAGFALEFDGSFTSEST